MSIFKQIFLQLSDSFRIFVVNFKKNQTKNINTNEIYTIKHCA